MRVFLFILLSIVSFEVSAKCNQKEADKGIQGAMNECAYEGYKIADNKLNSVYKTRMDDLKKTQHDYPNEESSKELVNKFKKAQLAWLKYRDAECDDQYYSFYGGSMAHLVHSLCLETLTKERINEIESKQK